jgi:DNA-binding winged helix-turn-helix (wHTH) protein
MAMSPETSPSAARFATFTVGDWLVEPKACHASRGDTVVKLRPQLVDLLLCLARRAGDIVLKDEILAEVWPGQYIADSGLSRCIAELRQILNDDAQQPRIIETIPKRGYRLVAPVAWRLEAPAGPLPDGRPTVVERSDAAADAPLESQATAVERFARWRTPGRLSGALAVVVVVIVAITGVMLTRSRAKVLTEQDTVLLAFENETGDAVFDEAVPLATAIQLEQSPYLRLVSPGRIQETLQMMRRPADTPISRAVGMEVCERIGGHAVIVTSIAALGRQYVIGLEAVESRTGRVLARRQATTERREQVLGALQRAAGEIRLAVGESPASLATHSLPPVEGTTASLEALRAVRRGDLAIAQGQMELALTLYRDAVALDASFALAHSRLGSIAFGAERLAALEKAYALRQQVTFPERLEIEAAYHRWVTGEVQRVVDALEDQLAFAAGRLYNDVTDVKRHVHEPTRVRRHVLYRCQFCFLARRAT